MKDNADQTIITNIPDMSKEKDMHAYVIFLSGPLMGKLHLLEEGELTVGRGVDVSLTINDLGISRHHASLHYKNGTATLKDLGSTNGTYLNGVKVQRAELKDGDRIQLSSATILKYSYQDKIENVFHKELYKMAVVDALTGAYNKRYFEERVREEFSYCLRNKVPLSMLMFDIDYFKKFNDTYGHPAGDYILSRIVELTKSVVRNEDIVARYGGEEFIVVLKGTDAAGAQTLSERLRSLIDESLFEFEGKEMHVTISAGVASLADHGFSNWEEMLKSVDTLLYKSKNGGRNRVSC